MRGWAGVLGLLLVGCRWAPAPSHLGPLPGVTAVYVYDDVVRKPEARERFWREAGRLGVEAVYLQSAHLAQDSPEEMETFLRQARRHGLQISFLAGRAQWALPEGHAEALSVARKALALADQAGLESLQFDVEPYLLPQWKRDPNGVANAYLDLFESLHHLLGPRLPLHACIPFWFDRVMVRRGGRLRPLSEWVLDTCDGAVIMDYRDSASRLVSGAESELAYAARKGKGLTLAVNITPSDERGTSFHGWSEPRLRGELAEASARLKTSPAFRGFAVFHYGAWGGGSAP